MPPELAPYFAAVDASKARETAAQTALAAAQKECADATAQRQADVTALKAAVTSMYPDAA